MAFDVGFVEGACLVRSNPPPVFSVRFDPRCLSRADPFGFPCNEDCYILPKPAEVGQDPTPFAYPRPGYPR